MSSLVILSASTLSVFFSQGLGPCGTNTGNTPMTPPETGVIIKGYGVTRDPLLGTAKLHAGVDYLGDTRSVRVAADGKVVFAGALEGYGKTILVVHDHGLGTLYAHLDRFSVREGTCVKSGTEIGLEGDTGRASSVHLHFEVRKNGVAVDPITYLKNASAP